MKKLLLSLLVALAFVACNKGDDTPKPIELTGGTATSQTVYADETQKSDGIKFNAIAPWNATVNEVAVNKTDGRDVKWLTLSAYEGAAGEQAITLNLLPNATGSDRKAEIKITCSGTIITITVTQDSKTQSGIVPEDPNVVKSISLNNTQLTITTGESEELIATISPSTATNKNVIWTSSNPEVASVDRSSKDPNNGFVLAKIVGTTEITATTEDGGKTTKCIVTVKASAIKIPGQVKSINSVKFVFNPTGQIVVGREIGSSAKYYAERFTFEGGTIGGGGKLTHVNGMNWDSRDGWDQEYIYDGDYLKQINYKVVPEPEFNNYTYHIFNTWENGNLTRIGYSIGSSSVTKHAVLEYTDILHPESNLDINLYTVFLWGSFGSTCLSPEYYTICDNNLGARSKYLVRKVTYSSDTEPTTSTLNFERTFRYEIYAGQVSAIYYTDKAVNDANPQQERKLCDLHY